jgi:hypothetical protein
MLLVLKQTDELTPPTYTHTPNDYLISYIICRHFLICSAADKICMIMCVCGYMLDLVCEIITS